MRYYLSSNGQSLAVSGDPSMFSVPEGFTEVTVEEYEAARAADGTGAIPVDLPAPGRRGGPPA